MVRSRRLNIGAPTRRGGRSITLGSTCSDSNTIEQAGSMTSSRKAICTGSSTSGQPGDEHRDERHPEDRDVDGEDVGHRLVEVVEDPASLTDAAGDRGEVVVGDDQVGGLARDVGAAGAHGDADVGGAQRRGVVDAVAGHADDLAVGLERADELELLLGDHAGEHVDRSALGGRVRRRSSS